MKLTPELQALARTKNRASHEVAHYQTLEACGKLSDPDLLLAARAKLKAATHAYDRALEGISVTRDKRARAYRKRYHQEHREERIAYNRQYHYGLTPEGFQRLLSAQGNSCAICGYPLEGSPIHIDHDHETNVVRGLLCQQCNQGLGMFGDDPERLRAAALYLEAARSHAQESHSEP